MNCKVLFSLGLMSLSSVIFFSCGDIESSGVWDDIYDGPSTSSSLRNEESSSSSEYTAQFSSAFESSSSRESSSSCESSSSVEFSSSSEDADDELESSSSESSSSVSSSSEQSSSSMRAPATLTYAEGCDAVTRENWDYLNPDVEYGCIKDARDGRYYKTVIIGDRVWLAENLRYVSQKSSWCYTESAAGECDIYGRYYSGYAINEEPGICPEGFHVATEQEMKLLFVDYSEPDLLTVDGWKQSTYTIATTNASGFSLLPGGCRAGNDPQRDWVLGEFDGVEGIARLWTGTQDGAAAHTEMAFANTTGAYGTVSFPGKNNDFGIPVRCIND